MENYHVLPIETECIQFNQTRYLLCLPRVVDCFPQNDDGLLTLPGEEWNCNLPCPADREYYVPFVIGDKIDIQTRFYNLDRNPETFFLGVDLVDKNNNIVTSVLGNFLSDYMAGKDNNDLDYQILRIDTSLPAFDGLTCFQLQISLGDVAYHTQWFKIAQNCKQTILLKSKPRRTDCLNNYYGEPSQWVGTNNLTYNNELRYYADLKYGGSTTADGESLIFKTLISAVTLLPPFMINYITFVHLGHAKVTIEGKEYDIDGVPRAAVKANGNMSQINVDVINRCKKSC